MEEGSDPDSVALCVVISNLPAGGLQCDIVATLTPMEDTACMYRVSSYFRLHIVIQPGACLCTPG